MALFRRKKNESVMPEEVRDFYASEQRDRKGMAWLLAIVTLLVTFVIAALLFFGGRWVYRTVFDNDHKDKTTTSQEEQAEEADQADTAKSDDSAKKSDSSSQNSSSNNSSSTNGNTGTSSLNTNQTVPNTGPSELVNTGPGDE